jgi:hypothetical protein
MQPAAQRSKVNMSHEALNLATNAWLLAGSLRFAELALAAPARADDLRSPPLAPKGKLSDSETWFPELKPVDTDQSGLNPGCGKVRHNSNGKLASPRNQMRCFVAAAARFQKKQHMPAAARTTKLSISTAATAPT